MCVGAFYVSMCWTMRRARVIAKFSIQKLFLQELSQTRSILPFKILRIDVQFQLLQGNDVEKPLDDKTSVDDDEKEPEPELKPFSMKKAYLLLPAALCDMLGTSTMYVALTLTSASSFQMLRGINK